MPWNLTDFLPTSFRQPGFSMATGIPQFWVQSVSSQNSAQPSAWGGHGRVGSSSLDHGGIGGGDDGINRGTDGHGGEEDGGCHGLYGGAHL